MVDETQPSPQKGPHVNDQRERVDVEEWAGFAAECLARSLPNPARTGDIAARALCDVRDRRIVALCAEVKRLDQINTDCAANAATWRERAERHQAEADLFRAELIACGETGLRLSDEATRALFPEPGMPPGPQTGDD